MVIFCDIEMSFEPVVAQGAASILNITYTGAYTQGDTQQLHF